MLTSNYGKTSPLDHAAQGFEVQRSLIEIVQVYDNICEMRADRTAPVDSMGCERFYNSTSTDSSRSGAQACMMKLESYDQNARTRDVKLGRI